MQGEHSMVLIILVNTLLVLQNSMIVSPSHRYFW